MARTGRPKSVLVLAAAEREQLARWARRPKTELRLALRSRIVLRCADGLDNDEVAAELGVHPKTVGKWRRRFLDQRLDGLWDDPRPGVPRSVSDAKVEQIVRRTIEETPPDATHWSTRSMAARVGVSRSTVKPDLAGVRPQAAPGRDVQDLDRSAVRGEVRDVVGLYLDPPECALVFCVNEKSQIQALDRSQPILPVLPGTPARMSHDYRHGTNSLFAVLDVASGKVIGGLHARHRAVEFRKFLDQLDHDVPAELEVHLILDNYATTRRPPSNAGSCATPASCCISCPKAPAG